MFQQSFILHVQFEFCIIFVCHKITIPLIFSPTIKKCKRKTFLACGPYKKRQRQALGRRSLQTLIEEVSNAKPLIRLPVVTYFGLCHDCCTDMMRILSLPSSFHDKETIKKKKKTRLKRRPQSLAPFPRTMGLCITISRLGQNRVITTLVLGRRQL